MHVTSCGDVDLEWLLGLSFIVALNAVCHLVTKNLMKFLSLLDNIVIEGGKFVTLSYNSLVQYYLES